MVTNTIEDLLEPSKRMQLPCGFNYKRLALILAKYRYQLVSISKASSIRCMWAIPVSSILQHYTTAGSFYDKWCTCREIGDKASYIGSHSVMKSKQPEVHHAGIASNLDASNQSADVPPPCRLRHHANLRVILCSCRAL